MWQETLNILLQGYKPVATAAQSKQQFTTLEIYSQLQDHCGCEDFSIHDVAEQLKSLGFTYARTSSNSLSLEWLFG